MNAGDVPADSILARLMAKIEGIEETMGLLARTVISGEERYTIKEAARLLRRAESTIWAYVSDGRLGSVKESGRRMILRRHIEEFQRGNDAS